MLNLIAKEGTYWIIFFRNNKSYIKMVLVIIVSYLSIKLIDNIPSVMSAIHTILAVLLPFY